MVNKDEYKALHSKWVESGEFGGSLSFAMKSIQLVVFSEK